MDLGVEVVHFFPEALHQSFLQVPAEAGLLEPEERFIGTKKSGHGTAHRAKKHIPDVQVAYGLLMLEFNIL